MNWKVLCLIASLALTSGLAACSEDNAAGDNPTNSPAAETTKTTDKAGDATKATTEDATKSTDKPGDATKSTTEDATKSTDKPGDATKSTTEDATKSTDKAGDAVKPAGNAGDATSKPEDTTKP